MPAQYPRGRAPMSIAGISKRKRFGRGRFKSFGFYGTFGISGVTRDELEAVLPNCTVHLFRTGGNSYVSTVLSDGSGNYSFVIGNNAGNFYAVAYLAGSPDVAGTTVNTLVAVQIS